jgi:hypothetical protein
MRITEESTARSQHRVAFSCDRAPALALALAGTACAVGSRDGGFENDPASAAQRAASAYGAFGPAASQPPGLDCSQMGFLFVVDDSDSRLQGFASIAGKMGRFESICGHGFVSGFREALAAFDAQCRAIVPIQ